MKSIKVYLSVVTGLLVTAIGLGVYVWYTVQELNKSISNATQEGESVPAPTTEQISTIPTES